MKIELNIIEIIAAAMVVFSAGFIVGALWVASSKTNKKAENESGESLHS